MNTEGISISSAMVSGKWRKKQKNNNNISILGMFSKMLCKVWNCAQLITMIYRCCSSYWAECLSTCCERLQRCIQLAVRARPENQFLTLDQFASQTVQSVHCHSDYITNITHFYIEIAIVASDESYEFGGVSIVRRWQWRRRVYCRTAIKRTGRHQNSL